MKYIKLYEDLKTYNEFNNVLTLIKGKLNIIGFDITANNSMERLHLDKYEVTINLDLNCVKNSFLDIISNVVINEYDSNKGKYNPKVFYVKDNDDVVLESLLKHIQITITNLNKEDILIKVFNNLINQFSNDVVAMRIGGTNYRNYICSYSAKLLKIFLKDNNYTFDVVISDEFIATLFEFFEYYEKSLSFINNLKTHQPLIYSKLKSKYGDGIDKSATMGEMGFDD